MNVNPMSWFKLSQTYLPELFIAYLIIYHVFSIQIIYHVFSILVCIVVSDTN